MATLIRMPEVLANASEAAIQTWLVKLGQQVSVGDPLAEVETEKATVEYAAESAGTVLKLLAEEGVSVKVGDPIAILGAEGESVDDVEGAGPEADAAAGVAQPVAQPAAQPVAQPAAQSTPVTAAPEPETAQENGPSPLAEAPSELRGASGGADSQGTSGQQAPEASGERASGGGASDPESADTASADAASSDPESADTAPADAEASASAASGTGGRQFVSPLVRRLAKERDIDLAGVQGTGPGGRIVRKDIEGLAATSQAQAARATAAASSTAAAPAAAPAAEATEIPHTSMRRAIARRLTESKSTVPHFYLVADCRVDRLVALRAEANETSAVKLSINDFVIKAAAAAFADVPGANVTWGEAALTRYSTVDMSIAVAIEGGLVTPVLRSVEKLSLTEINRGVTDLADRSRAGELRQHELEGGSFAISNLGMYGTTEFSAIINPPQSAILAVGAARQQPVVDNGELAVGTVMTVTLSADHRALDGALAAQWLAAFVKRIENPVSTLL